MAPPKGDTKPPAPGDHGQADKDNTKPPAPPDDHSQTAKDTIKPPAQGNNNPSQTTKDDTKPQGNNNNASGTDNANTGKGAPPPVPPQTSTKGDTPQKLSEVLKVCTLQSVGTPDKVIATIPMSNFDKTTKLSDVRTKLHDKLDKKQVFQYQDASSAEETELLFTYIRTVNETIDQKNADVPIPCRLFVSRPGLTAANDPTTSLLDGSFSMKIMEWQTKSGEEAKSGLTSSGTMLSQQLGTKPAAKDLTLAQLRTKIRQVTSMSTSAKIHQFCTPSGSTVADDTTTFADYLRLGGDFSDKLNDKLDLPSVNVVYKVASLTNQPKVDLKTLPGAFSADSSKLPIAKGTSKNYKLSDGQRVAKATELGKPRATLGDDKTWTPTSGAAETE
ncbi:uncharacterized protein KY384_004656 [Bacidia gigantensis]|uniref:uncharacterized protein n=1 Tax=Bacidia gigantensis TaxID=2732470 RepID=UPI001D045804|nr:uncharacterized protein KY384_004656 [Bacidia gigantensis]KAG8530618.1 hypothetical protein KY384_004656 [Bacidia gigantensis]